MIVMPLVRMPISNVPTKHCERRPCRRSVPPTDGDDQDDVVGERRIDDARVHLVDRRGHDEAGEEAEARRSRSGRQRTNGHAAIARGAQVIADREDVSPRIGVVQEEMGYAAIATSRNTEMGTPATLPPPKWDNQPMALGAMTEALLKTENIGRGRAPPFPGRAW